ncbi:hypothetical protein [Microcoleus sp. MON2_D5]|uniref:hypothetical protein n=1 Tax=Microcoleus sp. MON2_D5 TaxID=2818833 RepID=UPI002FD45925
MLTFASLRLGLENLGSTSSKIDHPNASLLLDRSHAGPYASGNSRTPEVPGERSAVSGNLSARVALKVL